MNMLLDLLHDWLPALAVIMLVVGLKKDSINYIIAALWVSLIALLLHYQTAGGEILGTYFNYRNAGIYSINLLVLMTTLLCLFYKLPIFHGKCSRYATALVSICLVIASLLLLINLWINACFIEHRSPGTPIMQVATFTKLPYCNYRYVFYKVNTDNKISYLCPNYYGIIPSVGKLDVSSKLLLKQLGQDMKAKFEMDKKGL